VELRDLAKVTASARSAGLLSKGPAAGAGADVSEEDDPNVALASVRISLERILRGFARSRDIDVERQGLGQMINVLAQKEALPPATVATLRDMVPILNRAVHGERVDPGATEWARTTGAWLLAGLVHDVGMAMPGRNEKSRA